MKLIFALIGFLFLTGCASTNVQTDCEQQGDSQYFHCKKYPWYKAQCNRFE